MPININLIDTKLFDSKSDAVALFVEQDSDLSKIKDLEKYCPNIQRYLGDKEFKGGSGSSIVLPTINADFAYLILLGLGKRKNGVINIETYRRALGRLVRIFPQYTLKSVAFELPNKFGESEEYVAKQTSMILQMADYIFDEFITEKDRISDLTTDVNIVVSFNEKIKLQKALDEGSIIGNAVNDARSWIDLPSNKLTPADLSAHAEQISLDYGLKCTVFQEEQLNEMGMGGISAVAIGSEKDARMVIMEYHCGDKNAPTVGFIGKGITFDSGGLSLKPAVHMETMKEDMSGAAAVISAMKALGQLKPKINIIAIAPITENMPSGTSVKPGDIVTFYNGKTAEIKNTDAEGRLILADAFSYAIKHYKLDAMIDLATLTGACAYALGPFFSGLFSEHEDFVNRVFEAANLSGDYVWRLPLTDDYKKAVKAEVADLSNTGDKIYQAGGTTAACFLQHFVGDVPWVHLDIAGTAFNVPDIPYYRRYSATGAGVRLLVELAMHWK